MQSILLTFGLMVAMANLYLFIRSILELIHSIGSLVTEIEQMSNRVEQLERGVSRLAFTQLDSSVVLNRLVFRDKDRDRFGYRTTQDMNGPLRVGSGHEDSDDDSDDSYIYEESEEVEEEFEEDDEEEIEI
ncbi:hypothetical protein AOL_s00081g101 [Orbilia oligospora ATCC 24927]|uniref:Uncharacterized protein n=2 Tax=Orbilia oligospora TaxID=2813651 RepID=G1XFF9_ARTOA|nr:hypothetical protein AOL_s00081g101 [Orbilia oligospora ATCC 24927]EGX48105.1 hypothetical protein AOL_s00081g101 [Orbilia oligospora ATCC 24927]KAF3290839.1 hypothetical protein TWF970_000101 [Orbilia oligospora]